MASIRTTILIFSLSYITTIVNLNIFYQNIYITLLSKLITIKYNPTKSHWFIDYLDFFFLMVEFLYHL